MSEIRLSERDINAIVHQLRLVLRQDLVKMLKKEQAPDLVTTAEAAAILRITPDRLRHIVATDPHRYPHTKTGEGKQARLLFDRKALIQ